MTLYGNRSKAFLLISELCINAVRTGFAHKHPLCWLWQSIEEQKLLTQIQTFSLAFTNQLMDGFINIDHYHVIFGYFSQQKWANQFSKEVKEFYESLNDTSAYARQIAAKKHFVASLKKLSNEIKQQNDIEKKGNKNGRVRKNNKSKCTNISTSEQ